MSALYEPMRQASKELASAGLNKQPKYLTAHHEWIFDSKERQQKRTASAFADAVLLVEVNGLEPLTLCL